jgi:hypothetical protein
MDAFLAMLREIGRIPPRGGYAFGHGVSHDSAPASRSTRRITRPSRTPSLES